MGQVLHIVPWRPKVGLQVWQTEALVHVAQLFGHAIIKIIHKILKEKFLYLCKIGHLNKSQEDMYYT